MDCSATLRSQKTGHAVQTTNFLSQVRLPNRCIIVQPYERHSIRRAQVNSRRNPDTRIRILHRNNDPPILCMHLHEEAEHQDNYNETRSHVGFPKRCGFAEARIVRQPCTPREKSLVKIYRSSTSTIRPEITLIQVHCESHVHNSNWPYHFTNGQ